jgi:hypothetical protein
VNTVMSHQVPQSQRITVTSQEHFSILRTSLHGGRMLCHYS